MWYGAQRIGGADVFDRRHLAFGAVDLHFEVRGGERAVRLRREELGRDAPVVGEHHDQALRRTRGQQGRLHALGKAHFPLQPLLVRRDFLVEPRVLDGHGRLAGQQREHFRVLLRECVELRALEIEDADDFVVRNDGRDHVRARFVARVDVNGIVANVGRNDRRGTQRDAADESFAELEV